MGAHILAGLLAAYSEHSITPQDWEALALGLCASSQSRTISFSIGFPWLPGWLATELGIPLFPSVSQGANWEISYALLADFPDLTCVICDHGCWGEDRRFRPLIERYPNVYVDTSQYVLDGGIEAFVDRYGHNRMLFGSGFPESYFGGMMLAIRHAEISPEAKQAIACGNLERLLAWSGEKVEVRR